MSGVLGVCVATLDSTVASTVRYGTVHSFHSPCHYFHLRLVGDWLALHGRGGLVSIPEVVFVTSYVFLPSTYRLSGGLYSTCLLLFLRDSLLVLRYPPREFLSERIILSERVSGRSEGKNSV